MRASREATLAVGGGGGAAGGGGGAAARAAAAAALASAAAAASEVAARGGGARGTAAVAPPAEAAPGAIGLQAVTRPKRMVPFFWPRIMRGITSAPRRVDQPERKRPGGRAEGVRAARAPHSGESSRAGGTGAGAGAVDTRLEGKSASSAPLPGIHGAAFRI